MGGVEKTKKAKANEKDYKKVKAAKEKTLKEECKILEKKNMGVREKRNKAVSAFSKARLNLIAAQGSMNNVKPYDASQEKTTWVNKGAECAMQEKHLLSEVSASSATECKKQC